jgi:FkbM family methyltransferase
MLGERFLRRWRERYYVSNVLAMAAKPLYQVSHGLSVELLRRIRKNGAAINLPNGRILRFARNSGIEIGSLLFWKSLDGFEPATSTVLRFFFERSASFVDVGANYGYYSILAALWNSELVVTSFEPVPQIYGGLTRNISLNGIGSRVTAYPAALSDRTGRATLFLPLSQSTDYESTGTLASESWQSRQYSPSFEVETLRFDDFERSHPMKVDLVKIDVEDFEASVLRGMAETICRDRPFIVCEILTREHKNLKTKEILEQLGYTPYWIVAPDCYVRVSQFDFRRDSSTDFLLSPVSVPGEVVTGLEVFWTRRQNRA